MTTFTKPILKSLRPLAMVSILIVGACQDPYNHELDTSKLDYAENDVPQETALDTWLYDNFTAPYNIEVKYRWNLGELSVTRVLVPPLTSKVQPLMNVISDAWITPYVEEAGDAFFKTFCPKWFVLIGSPQYNPGGTITLGTAEGGRQVVLYVVNNFDQTSRTRIKEQMHTVHHEFGHILHQNILYPTAFKEITPGAYTADWSNIPVSTAQSKGFITSYAMSAPDEDFVELIAMMLTEGARGFDRIVCAIPDEEGQAIIRQKQQIVISYFSEAYDIDFYALQESTDGAIDSYAPKTLLADLGYNSGQNFNTIEIDPSRLPALPAAFQAIYTEVEDNVNALTDPELTLEYIDLIFDGYGNSAVRFVITRDDDESAEKTLYAADFYYTVSVNAAGEITLIYDDQNGNGDLIADAVQSMLDYFQDHSFTLDWIPYDTDDCVYDYGGIFPVGDASLNSFGLLTN